jgi:hypothetical protein
MPWVARAECKTESPAKRPEMSQTCSSKDHENGDPHQRGMFVERETECKKDRFLLTLSGFRLMFCFISMFLAPPDR